MDGSIVQYIQWPVLLRVRLCAIATKILTHSHCFIVEPFPHAVHYLYIYVHKYLYNPHGLETTVPSFWIARNNLGYHIRSLPFSPHVSWQHMPLAWSDHRPAFLLTSLSTFLPSSTILRGASELPGSGII